MRMKVKQLLSQILYIAGATILFILAIVCMIAFIKAVRIKDEIVEKPQKIHADSIQIVMLYKEINILKAKVDSLITISQQKPKVKYKYLKSRKDTCVIELNVNKLADSSQSTIRSDI